MIPRASITAWRTTAPWPDDAQVEQDLVLSRALIAMFDNPTVAAKALFRGGTALHKLFLDEPGRYSEDIDLVQREAGPIGDLVNAIRGALDPWMGAPKWKQSHGRFTLYYRFSTTFEPVVRMRLKVEINTREHFNVLELTTRRYEIKNPWFSGSADLPTYALPELLGTKLRALYQRKAGRDLLDLWLAHSQTDLDHAQTVVCFEKYMDSASCPVTRAQFEQNMSAKMADQTFIKDVDRLLRSDLIYDPDAAWGQVHASLIRLLPGRPWKGESK